MDNRSFPGTSDDVDDGMRTILLLAIGMALALSGVEAPPVLPKPSPNAGKPGTYQVQCSQAGYSYYVSVPAKPLADAAYGLYLFFHGQNGQNGAASFGQWQGRLLDGCGLIGINMCYADGDNMRDTPGKVLAARAAVLQVMADYPVAPGRGLVGCFSGGGLPCGAWYSESARNRGLAWPFTGVALFSANFRSAVQPLPQTGWYVGVNTDEWTLAELGHTQTARFGEALQALAKSGPDHRLLVVRNLGHSIPDQGVAEAAALFRRLDLAYAPFLHAPSYPKPLAGIVAAANDGQIGQAAAALAKLKEDPATAEAVAGLRARLDARAGAQVALLSTMSADDPLLTVFYGQLFAKALKGHPREAEAKTIAATAAKGRRAGMAGAALEAFAKGYAGLFAGGANLTPAGVQVLEQLQKSCGEGSHYGRMATELLALPHAPGK